MNIIETTEQFDFVVKESRSMVIYFWATWCAPCKAIAPTLEALCTEYTATNFVKVNVDEVGKIAERYGVRGIPTMIFLKDGKVVDQLVGAVPKTQLVQSLEKTL